MSHFGLEGESLFHLGQCFFLRSAQHDGYIYHQTEQGGTILQTQRGRRKEEESGEPAVYEGLSPLTSGKYTAAQPDNIVLNVS